MSSITYTTAASDPELDAAYEQALAAARGGGAPLPTSSTASPGGVSGKGGLGPHYLPQFMREQSRTVMPG